MDEITRDVIVSIGSFLGIFGIVYVYFMTRHRERMSMLEKGLQTSPFASVKNTNLQTLKYGMLLVGIALGIVMGHILTYQFNVAKSTAFMAMLFLFGGISLIVNYLIVRKQKD